jgi:hypothetical protein
MNVKSLLAGVAFAAVSLTAVAAQAGVVLLNSSPGELSTEAAPVVDTFHATGGAGTVSLIVDGYGSLDGQNFYEDDFTLSLNGVTTLTGTFNLGGGGASIVYSAPAGTTANNLSDPLGLGQVTFAGGQEALVAPVTLNAGTNVLSFVYSSLAAPNHAGFQGVGDEGWGVHDVQVSGAIPEPSTWAMMLVGFGGLGAVLRSARRRNLQAA